MFPRLPTQAVTDREFIGVFVCVIVYFIRVRVVVYFVCYVSLAACVPRERGKKGRGWDWCAGGGGKDEERGSVFVCWCVAEVFSSFAMQNLTFDRQAY